MRGRLGDAAAKHPWREGVESLRLTEKLCRDDDRNEDRKRLKTIVARTGQTASKARQI